MAGSGGVVTGAATGGTSADPGSGGGTATGGAATGGTATGGTNVGGGGMATFNPGDAAVPRWCDTQRVLFCEDFDGVSTIDEFLSGKWFVSTTGGTFSFDTSAGTPSPPHALRVRTNSASNVTAIGIHSIPPFGSAPSKLRLQFALRIDSGDDVGVASGAVFAGIVTGARLADGIIGLEVGPGPSLRAGFQEPANGQPTELPLPSAFPTEGAWLGPYVVEADFSTDRVGTRTGCIQIFDGGVPQLDGCSPLPASLVDPPVISIALGVYSGGLGLTGDVQLAFDNVTLTAE
ncbi:MAG TPA: hypothetical protein VH062_32430 [Polyangiaceae bacterium]|jgi:hypothetical protein|nr:hypothetical protein [Polyangiaceae bacterium]